MQLPLHVLLLVGSFFVVAIRGSQFVHTWGVQARGRTIPGRIAAINDTFLPQNDPIKSITVGMFHAALLTESGRVFGWGQHEKGQLGSSPSLPVDVEYPMEIDTSIMIGKVVQISAGSYCLLFLTEHTDGLQRLYMVGSLGANSDASFVPQLVDTSQVSRHGAKITKLRAGHTHALIVTDIGKLFGFGDNLFGQLGLETVLRSPSSLREIPFPFGIEIIDAAAGGWHSVALSDDGQVFTFGDNTFGALGRDVYGLHKTPTPISIDGVTFFKAIAAGGMHTLVLSGLRRFLYFLLRVVIHKHFDTCHILPLSVSYLEEGTNDLWAFGKGAEFQLQRLEPRTKDPVQVLLNNTLFEGEVARDIACGWMHSLIVTESGRIFTFGGACSVDVLGRSGCGWEVFPIAYEFEQVISVATGGFATFVLSSGNMTNVTVDYPCTIPLRDCRPLEDVEFPVPPTTEAIKNEVSSVEPGSDNLPIIVAVTIVGSIIILLLVVVIIILSKKKKILFFRPKTSAGLDVIEITDINLKEIPTEDIKLGDVIGKGHFGVVRKGDWEGSTVALKSIKTGDLLDDFITEIRLLSNLSHPNILRILGLYTSVQNEKFLVSEYMSKGSLDAYLQQNKVTPREIISVLMQLASGMIYLHNQNVIHRDLSARNVLCKEEDGQLTVKVADFGLSRLVKEDYYLSEAVSLPVKWCAIEVLKFRKFTTKSDVWSFGVLMWEIYEHGAIPYPELTNSETMAKISQGYRMPKPHECPDEMYGIMVRCWSEDPNDRPDMKTIQAELKILFEHYEKTGALGPAPSQSKLISLNESHENYATHFNKEDEPYHAIGSEND